MHWSSWAIALNVLVLSRADEAPEGFPEDHIDLVIPMKMKYDSHLRQADLPPHFITANETNLVPLTLRMETRRKRCSCGCSGCDLFPNRSCCSSSCCSSQKPIPLACCPPPPAPKPCCQPAFGPCCPATPNCCPKPCCRGRRPEYEEYEDEEGNQGVPAPPNPPRTCCPPPTPAAPPPPPPPPPPAPEAPTQCCSGQPYGRTPCRSGCPNGDCGCGRPCCYYQNPTCCNQGQRPCCPPEQPCCPELNLNLGNCLASVPPCLRACPSCPCRKRLVLGKRNKRAAPGLHCQPIGLLGQQSPPTLISQPVKTIVKAKAKAAGTKTATSTTSATKKLIEQSSDHVEAPPTAGRLYDFRRAHVRSKRNLDGNGGCQLCLNGTPLKRTKRSLDCVACTYLQPQYSDFNPFLGDQRTPQQSPVGTPIHKREKRAGCLPHPQCTLHVRRYKRNLIGSQYCEPCNGHYGRKKREAERDQCLKREKRYAADEQCDNDEFSVSERSKRQAYNPKGILDIVKLLSKASAGGNGPGGCMKFPACVLAQKKRRKRNADRMEKYYKTVEEHKKQVEEYELAMEEHKRVKRQFFAPDNAAACVPCPAWVTLALASRKKREADDEKNGTTSKQMTMSEAIADIRSKKGYKEGFDEDDDESSEETIEMRRKQRRSCQQSDDCLNNVEYAVFQKVYADKRTKREAIFRRKKCSRCGVSGLTPHRVKRNFGQPNINVSEQNCMAFPQCRHRVKRNLFGEDCNICTQDTGLNRRRKRNFGTAQCYPCP